MTYRTGLFER